MLCLHASAFSFVARCRALPRSLVLPPPSTARRYRPRMMRSPPAACVLPTPCRPAPPASSPALLGRLLLLLVVLYHVFLVLHSVAYIQIVSKVHRN
jgi:hypothetical protein